MRQTTGAASGDQAPGLGSLVRWRVLACVLAFGFFGYMQRTGVATAAEHMIPELGLTKVEFGWLVDAFLASYTALQIPGAIVGQHLGARRALALVGILSVVAAVASAAVPVGPATVAVLVLVFGARILLGVAQSALFPVASGVIEAWFPLRHWNLANGLQVTGFWLGAACTPPLVAALMTLWGWRLALLATSTPVALLVVLWLRTARDRPADHPAISAAELAELAGNPPPVDSRVGLKDVLRLLGNRDIALLTGSYFLTNYVFYLVSFWCFTYLVEERHFAILEGGVLASLPFVSAAVAAGAGGKLADRLCERYGTRNGMRILPLVALPLAAVFLVLTGTVPGAPLAVAALCLAFACTELIEGPYWAATMRVAPTEVMAATAVLNTGGNLGGVVATPMIAMLSEGHHWSAIFALGAGVSVIAAALWAFVDVERSAAEH